MAQLRSAEDHVRQQTGLSTAVEGQAIRLWSKVSPAAIVSSWTAVASQIVRLITAGQLASAKRAAPYVERVLAEQNLQLSVDGSVDPYRFAGVAADGRPLRSMLDWTVTGKGGVLDRIGQGQGADEAMFATGQRIGVMAASSVQDAGRGAVGVEIAARERLGYVRIITPPSCARCVILAGKWFRWNEGFLRHPGCDCEHIPATEADSPIYETDPRAYLDSLSEVDQDRVLTKTAARAYRDGADLNQLVNAKRGTKSGLTTAEGTTRRGLAGQRLGGRQRLTPDGIYRIASDREEALKLLRRNGYLI